LVKMGQAFHVKVKQILKLKIFRGRIRAIFLLFQKNGLELVNMKLMQKKEKKLWIN